MESLTALLDTSLLAETGWSPSDIGADRWAFSIITVGELQAGVMMASDSATRAARLRRLSLVLSWAPLFWLDEGAASAYGELRAAAPGRPPSNDLWIAAIALANDFTLTTADARQASLPLVRSVLIQPNQG